MDIKQLYARYGELMVQAEIIQAQVQEVKGKIAQVLNNPAVAPKPEEKVESKGE